MNPCRTVSVSIKKPVAKVCAYLGDPAHFPEWSAFIVAIRRAGKDWYATTKGGEVRMTFTPPNPFGVLDHAVHPNEGPTVRVPIRVLEISRAARFFFPYFDPKA